MGRVTLKAMEEAFGTRPQDAICCVGPSICRDCFEVGEEVVEEFRGNFRRGTGMNCFTGRITRSFSWICGGAMRSFCGKPEFAEHIQVTDICTRCNPDYLFSHRFAGEERGNLAAFLCLRG